MAVSYRVATRYANALVGLAKEQNALDAVKEDMSSLVKLCSESRDFSLLLQSPIVNHDKKLSVLEAIFGGKSHDLSLAFFKLITKKNREADLQGIAKAFIEKYNVELGIQEVTVTTAVDLDVALESQFEQAVSKASGKKVVLNTQVDPELIAGYVLRVEDTQVDASVKAQLNKIKNQFSK